MLAAWLHHDSYLTEYKWKLCTAHDGMLQRTDSRFFWASQGSRGHCSFPPFLNNQSASSATPLTRGTLGCTRGMHQLLGQVIPSVTSTRKASSDWTIAQR